MTAHAGASPVPGAPALCARSLTKRFGQRVAVDRLDVDVPVGSFCGLVGPNGSGKTTTLRMAAGLQRPDDGRVWISGHDTWEQPGTVKALLGVVPDPMHLFDRLTAWELLGHFGELRGIDRGSVRSRSEELLGLLGLTDAAGTLIGGYSHGMRKKTALAAALLHRPAVLLLDEPFEGVDPVAAVTVRDLLARYCAGGGTVVFSSHVMDLVERSCDHVVVVSDGRVLAAGPIDAVRGATTLEQAFIGMLGSAPADPAGLGWLDGSIPGSAVPDSRTGPG
ncbi:MAG: ABC transporter ATP-binding protein [Actinomycetota bacterium]